MKKYIITQDQLESIEHFKRMFEYQAETVKDLCNEERDDVVYGFELGKMYSSLRQFFIEMMELESDIKKQIVTNEKD